MFRFTFRDVLSLTVVTALGVKGIDSSHHSSRPPAADFAGRAH